MKAYLYTHVTLVLDIEGLTPKERQGEAQAAVEACLASLDEKGEFAIKYDSADGLSAETGIKPSQLSQKIRKYADDLRYTRIAIHGSGYLVPRTPLAVRNEGKSHP